MKPLYQNQAAAGNLIRPSSCTIVSSVPQISAKQHAPSEVNGLPQQLVIVHLTCPVLVSSNSFSSLHVEKYTMSPGSRGSFSSKLPEKVGRSFHLLFRHGILNDHITLWIQNSSHLPTIPAALHHCSGHSDGQHCSWRWKDCPVSLMRIIGYHRRVIVVFSI